ncbi:hypothetical protein CPB84DRAFT_1780332 [Gymnopilus junonius]|uniref:Uncharacterized protein n=1 Tax=Gymnopilus junonius TaxID=109634 RepID=A0A9P5NMH3_GYMJU|nr:hypothetical protein CPB84DRAFT_1780332 [Gymnopilus junonius]
MSFIPVPLQMKCPLRSTFFHTITYSTIACGPITITSSDVGTQQIYRFRFIFHSCSQCHHFRIQQSRKPNFQDRPTVRTYTERSRLPTSVRSHYDRSPLSRLHIYQRSRISRNF